jgi:hypothetical protein
MENSKILVNRLNAFVSWENWIAILDELAALHPLYVLPDHGAFGDATLISKQRAYLAGLLAAEPSNNPR